MISTKRCSFYTASMLNPKELKELGYKEVDKTTWLNIIEDEDNRQGYRIFVKYLENFYNPEYPDVHRYSVDIDVCKLTKTDSQDPNGVIPPQALRQLLEDFFPVIPAIPEEEYRMFKDQLPF